MLVQNTSRVITLLTQVITRDLVGNKTQIDESLYSPVSATTTPLTSQFTYDNQHRLVSESYTDSITGSMDYTLDDVGNRLERSVSGLTIPSYSSSYNDNDWLNSDTYDDNGNTLESKITIGSLSLESVVRDEYDYKNRLILRKVYDLSGTVLQKTIHLKYDGNGDLNYKRVVYSGGDESIRYYITDRNNHTGYAQIVEELDGSGNLVSVNNYGLDLISSSHQAEDASNQFVWKDTIYIHDGAGSVRMLVDLNNNVIDTFSYDSYGTLIEHLKDAAQLVIPCHYGYRGERYMANLTGPASHSLGEGWYYLRARYYNPNSGRFHTMDTYEGRLGDPVSLHKYLYAHANPVTNWDPSGQFSLVESMGVGMAIGTLSSMATVSIQNYTKGNPWTSDDWDSVIEGAIIGAVGGAAGSLLSGGALVVGGKQALKWNLSLFVRTFFGRLTLTGRVVSGATVGGATSAAVSSYQTFLEQFIGAAFFNQSVDIHEARKKIGAATGWGIITGGILSTVDFKFATRSRTTSFSSFGKYGAVAETFTCGDLHSTIAGSTAVSVGNINFNILEGLWKERLNLD